MANLDKSYDTLKTMAINKYTSLNITSLKHVYAKQINSPRMFCQITDLDSLIRILEKRGVLSPVKIEAFERIFKAPEVGLKPELLNEHRNLIKREEKCVFMQKYKNETEVRFPEHTIFGQRLTPTVNSTTLPATQEILSDKIINMVSSQIGHSWKVLARYLKVVEESTIDKIEEDKRIKNNELRARLMLDNYRGKMAERGGTSLETITRLLKALRLGKQMDIHDTIQEMCLK